MNQVPPCTLGNHHFEYIPKAWLLDILIDALCLEFVVLYQC